MELRNILL